MDLGEKLISITERIYAGFVAEMEKSNIPPTLAVLIADDLHGKVTKEAFLQINRMRMAEELKGESDDSTEAEPEPDT